MGGGGSVITMFKAMSVPTGLDLDWTGTELGNRQMIVGFCLLTRNVY